MYWIELWAKVQIGSAVFSVVVLFAVVIVYGIDMWKNRDK